MYDTAAAHTAGMKVMGLVVCALHVLGEHLLTRIVMEDMDVAWDAAVDLLQETDGIGYDPVRGKDLHEDSLYQVRQQSSKMVTKKKSVKGVGKPKMTESKKDAKSKKKRKDAKKVVSGIDDEGGSVSGQTLMAPKKNKKKSKKGGGS